MEVEMIGAHQLESALIGAKDDVKQGTVEGAADSRSRAREVRDRDEYIDNNTVKLFPSTNQHKPFHVKSQEIVKSTKVVGFVVIESLTAATPS